MPDKPPERVWITLTRDGILAGVNRTKRNDGDIEYILASQVAPPAERMVICANCGKGRPASFLAGEDNFVCRYCLGTVAATPPADAPSAEPKERAREIVDDELDEMMSPHEYAATRQALINRIAAALAE